MTLDEKKSLWNEAVKLRLVGKITNAGHVAELVSVTNIVTELSHCTGWPVTRDIWADTFKQFSKAPQRSIKYRPGFSRGDRVKIRMSYEKGVCHAA